MPTFLAPVDLSQNELRNPRLQNLAAPPGSPVPGQVYFDTTFRRAFIWEGDEWVAADNRLDQGQVTNRELADDSVTTDKIADGTIINADISPTAAIAKTKLAYLAIVDADVAEGAALAYAKLNLAGSIVDADVATNAGIAYSKLNLLGSIRNADVAADAAIEFSKLEADPTDRTNHHGTQAASTISDFDDQVRTSRLDQMAAPQADVSMNGQRLTGLAAPTADTDAATKAYVDAARQGLDVKESVRAATTGPITLSGVQTIDDVAVGPGDRVLVRAQVDGAENGIYVVDAGAWTRSADADEDAEVTPGLFTFVEEGTVYGDVGMVLTTDGPVTLGTTVLTFVQFSGAGNIIAGAGLTKTGNQFDVGGTPSRIEVSADAVDIASDYAGQASIDTLGTVTTGTWRADTVDIDRGGTGAQTAADARANLSAAKSGVNDDITELQGLTTPLSVEQGGTGASTAAGARANLGTTGKAAFAVGDGSSTTFTVTHGLGTQDVTVTVYQGSSNAVVYPDVELTSNDTITLRFTVAPTANEFRVVIIG